MRTWYSAVYGSWRDPEGVQRLEPTYNRRDMFERAKETAKKTGKVVTVQGEKGIKPDYWKISPDGIITRSMYYGQ